jgi:hypothetical protein
MTKSVFLYARLSTVIAGLVPATSFRKATYAVDRDGRDKPGHDGWDSVPRHDDRCNYF